MLVTTANISENFISISLYFLKKFSLIPGRGGGGGGRNLLKIVWPSPVWCDLSIFLTKSCEFVQFKKPDNYITVAFIKLISSNKKLGWDVLRKTPSPPKLGFNITYFKGNRGSRSYI